jgi:hypothetical protein
MLQDDSRSPTQTRKKAILDVHLQQRFDSTSRSSKCGYTKTSHQKILAQTAGGYFQEA